VYTARRGEQIPDRSGGQAHRGIGRTVVHPDLAFLAGEPVRGEREPGEREP